MKDLTFESDGITYIIDKYFHYDKTGKNYVVYHEKGDTELFASSYEIVNDEVILNEINTDEEWDYIDSQIGGNNE